MSQVVVFALQNHFTIQTLLCSIQDYLRALVLHYIPHPSYYGIRQYTKRNGNPEQDHRP